MNLVWVNFYLLVVRFSPCNLLDRSFGDNTSGSFIVFTEDWYFVIFIRATQDHFSFNLK